VIDLVADVVALGGGAKGGRASSEQCAPAVCVNASVFAFAFVVASHTRGEGGFLDAMVTMSVRGGGKGTLERVAKGKRRVEIRRRGRTRNAAALGRTEGVEDHNDNRKPERTNLFKKTRRAICSGIVMGWSLTSGNLDRRNIAAEAARVNVETLLKDYKWPKEMPFSDQDFARFDETQDKEFYSVPRFVTHIDDNAINALTKFYGERLPPSGIHNGLPT